MSDIQSLFINTYRIVRTSFKSERQSVGSAAVSPLCVHRATPEMQACKLPLIARAVLCQVAKTRLPPEVIRMKLVLSGQVTPRAMRLHVKGVLFPRNRRLHRSKLP